MEAVASIVGAISGCLSFLGLVYMFGFWRGKVNNQIDNFTKTFNDYPPGEMWTMAKTLWDVYVMDALRHRPDLAEHGSGFKLNPEGEKLIPDYMKPLLDRIPKNPGIREDIATGYIVVKHIGLALISQMAEEKTVSVQEAIALLSTYLESSTNNSQPTS